MVPREKTLSKLKEQVYINAVRLFADACSLFERRSYPSAFAFAILSLEELGKLEMVDHICDDISLNRHVNGQEFLDHLFSGPMFFNHKNKQMWASDPMRNYKKKRLKDISDGVLDRAKQNAIYVGYHKRRIRTPMMLSSRKAYSELTIVFRKFKEVGDLGFNGFDCWSNAASRAKAKRFFIKVENSYFNLKKPK